MTFRLLTSIASRQKHNDYDLDCIYWFGDRSPARNRHWTSNFRRGTVWKPVPLIHREMNGKPVMLDNHRCPVCNPYTETEGNALIGWS